MTLGIIYTDTNGVVWDLQRGDVRLTPQGVRGLGMPPYSVSTKNTAARDGQKVDDWKLDPRDVVLPLMWVGAAVKDVDGIQAAFWAGLAPGEYGKLTVTNRSGVRRHLSVRFSDDNDFSLAKDPYLRDDIFAINLVADDPWWYGDAIESSYSLASSASTGFFNNGMGGPPFVIVPAAGAASFQITNPGDAGAWVKWKHTGPSTDFRVGVNGNYVSATITVASTSQLVIETDPLRQVALLDGVNVTAQLTEVAFAPIPKRSTAAVSISVTGVGVFTGIIQPRWLRGY